MAKRTLESRLDGALRLEEAPPATYLELRARLERVAQHLTKLIDAGRNVAAVTLEPGHQLTAGQQFNVSIRIPTLNDYRDTIFRAYLKVDGSAATLDFIGDAPVTVKTPAALEDAIVRFLGRDVIRTMIRSLRDLAASAPAAKPPTAAAVPP